MSPSRQILPAALSLLMLALPLWILHNSGDAGFGAPRFVFEGKLFTDRPIVTGGALDQPSLQKEYFLFCYSLAILFPFLVLSRWLYRKTSNPCRGVLAGASIAILAHPFSILAIFTWDAARYIQNMGFTHRRVVALGMAAAGFSALALLTSWLAGARTPRRAFGWIWQSARRLFQAESRNR